MKRLVIRRTAEEVETVGAKAMAPRYCYKKALDQPALGVFQARMGAIEFAYLFAEFAK